MTTTQQYALVLLDLEYIYPLTPYSTAQLYAIYLTHQTEVDMIFGSPNIGALLSSLEQYLPSITITDPDAIWG